MFVSIIGACCWANFPLHYFLHLIVVVWRPVKLVIISLHLRNLCSKSFVVYFSVWVLQMPFPDPMMFLHLREQQDCGLCCCLHWYVAISSWAVFSIVCIFLVSWWHYSCFVWCSDLLVVFELNKLSKTSSEIWCVAKLVQWYCFKLTWCYEKGHSMCILDTWYNCLHF